VKIIPLIVLTLLTAISLNSRSFAAAIYPSIAFEAPKNLNKQIPALQMKVLLSLSPKKYQQLTGKKLSLKQRIGLKFFQWTESKHLITPGEPTEKQSKYGKLSLILGLSSVVLLIIPVVNFFAVPAAVAGLIFGVKSLKGNNNTNGILGVVFSGLTLFLLLLIIIVIMIVLSSGIE
jgi:uncharacterized protein involved in cysteine biosynthesis